MQARFHDETLEGTLELHRRWPVERSAAVERYLFAWNRGGRPIRFRIDGTPVPLPPASILCLTPGAVVDVDSEGRGSPAGPADADRSAPDLVVLDQVPDLRYENGRLAMGVSRGADGPIFIYYLRDISSRIAQQEALVAARDEALAAERAKTDFLAVMSHEMRTPLNGVLGMVSLLGDTELDAEQREYVDIIETSGDALLAVINQVLDFSKIEAGKLDIERIETSPADIVGEIGALMTSQARQRNLTLLTYVGPGVPRLVRSDPLRLRQVLINLCSNALKFTQTGGVYVNLTRTGSDGDHVLLRFEVIDTGVGFAPEKGRMLFEAFTQEDGSTTRKFGGTGLGLAICKKLVELMGGTIGCDGNPGQGATFWFTVPAAVADARPAIGTADIAGTSVLVIDDEIMVCDVATRILGDAGARVDTAATLSDGLGRYIRAVEAGRRYDAVVVDYSLPDGKGFDFAESVKEAEGRLIMLTGHEDPLLRRRAHRCGFSHFLTKPIRQEDLCHVIGVAAGRVQRHSVVDERQVDLKTRTEDLRRRAGERPLLLIEDNQMNQTVARRQFAKLGLDCDIADNGRIGLEMALAGAYPAIFADCQMPEMDGFEFTRRLRAWEAEHGGHHIVIAMTANALQGDAERCTAVGMDDYVSKPVTIDRLAAMLDKWLPGGAAADGPGAPLAAAQTVRLNGQAAAAPAADGPIAVDLRQLSEILGDDDEEALHDILHYFADAIGPLLDRLVEGVHRRDRDAVRQVAHAAKGAARNAAAVGLGDVLAQMEASAPEADWTDIEQQLGQARQAVSGVKQYIDNLAA